MPWWLSGGRSDRVTRDADGFAMRQQRSAARTLPIAVCPLPMLRQGDVVFGKVGLLQVRQQARIRIVCAFQNGVFLHCDPPKWVKVQFLVEALDSELSTPLDLCAPLTGRTADKAVRTPVEPANATGLLRHLPIAFVHPHTPTGYPAGTVARLLLEEGGPEPSVEVNTGHRPMADVATADRELQIEPDGSDLKLQITQVDDRVPCDEVEPV